MNLHEYQGKELFARYALPVLPGQVAGTPEEARDVAASLGGTVVIKAQVQAGGRGKAGGVKLAHSPDEAFEKARDILALTIKGLPVRKVLVAEAADIAKEYYCAIVLDRDKKAPLVMLSAEGGVDIEEVARTAPEKIVRFHIPQDGLRPYMARNLMRPLFPDFAQTAQAADILLKLYRAFTDGDCSLAEINPLAVTPAGKVLALDAKVILDDNADFRHKDWEARRDPAERALGRAPGAREGACPTSSSTVTSGRIVQRRRPRHGHDGLDQHYGGEPANFLDIGGSSNPEKVTAALKILTSESRVRAILFNIFGGITRCDDVANGIVASLKASPLEVPLVIRLTGTNEEKARQILKDFGLGATTSMDEAVRMVIEKAQEVGA
jgi:succinyl-CoA synthetase beta subunit